MSIKIYTDKDFEPHSVEWHQARQGRITGTKLKEVFTNAEKPKQGRKMLCQIVSEMMTDTIPDNFVSDDMQRGLDLEDEAFELYEKKFGIDTTKVSFIVNEEKPYLGLSPDRS